jgi:outer membrane biosynthesis protein TonB
MHWKEREPVYVRRRQLALEDFGGHVPAYAPGTFGGEQEGEIVETPARRGRKQPQERQRLGRAGRPSSRPVRGNGPQTGTVVEEPPAVEAPEPEEIEEPREAEVEETHEAEVDATHEAEVDATPSADVPEARDSDNGADGADGADRADGADGAGEDRQSSTSSTSGPNRPSKKQQQRRRKRHGRR